MLYNSFPLASYFTHGRVHMGFPGDASGKESTCQCRRPKRYGSDPGSGRPPGGGHGNTSSILVWRIPWAEGPGVLQSWGHKELDTTEVTEHSESSHSLIRVSAQRSQVRHLRTQLASKAPGFGPQSTLCRARALEPHGTASGGISGSQSWTGLLSLC